jgi:hypothetical protein
MGYTAGNEDFVSRLRDSDPELYAQFDVACDGSHGDCERCEHLRDREIMKAESRSATLER